MAPAVDSLSGRPLLATRADQRLFAGREDVTSRLVQAVRSRFNVLLLGERGVGKTSLLHHLSYELRRLDEPPKTVYVDASLAADATELLLLVRYGLGRQPQPLQETLASLPFGRDRHPLPEVGQLLQILESLSERGAGGDMPDVVLADGLPAHVAHAVFGQLRDELWQLPLRWVVSGDVERRADYLRPPADAFFDVALTLEPLDEAAQRNLLARRLGRGALPRADLLTALLSGGGGNPRRTIALARELAASDASPDAVALAGERWRQRLGTLTRPARMLVAELEARRDPVSASDPELLARLGWTRERAGQVLRQLEAEGLVEAAAERPSDGRPGRPRKVYSLRRDPGANG